MGTAITGTQMRTLKASVVTELPDKGVSNKIYYVPNGTTGDNKYDEYIWIKDTEHPNGYFEKVGQKDIDLNIDNLPIKESISGTEKIVVSDGGENKGVELSKVKEYAAGGELNEDKLKEIGVYFDEPDYWSFQGWGDFDGINFKKDLYVKRNVKINGGFSVGRIQGCYQIQLDDAGYLTVGEKLIVLGNPTNYSSNQVYNAIGGLTQVYSKAETDEKLSAKADTTKASTTSDGLMSKEDKAKLDGLSPKEQLFIDMWNSACGTYGKYNTETGFYELNGLTDITYEQALVIYVNTSGAKGSGLGGVFRGLKIRTHLPFQKWPGSSVGGVSASYIFTESNVEIVDMHGAQLSTGVSAFEGCSNLKSLENTSCYYSTSGNYVNFFKGCVALENVSMNIHSDFSFVDSPLLTYKCMQNIISWSKNKEAITIILHPTTYAYLQGTTAPTEQVGGTTEQWQALVTAATNKKISFATK